MKRSWPLIVALFPRRNAQPRHRAMLISINSTTFRVFLTSARDEQCTLGVGGGGVREGEPDREQREFSEGRGRKVPVHRAERRKKRVYGSSRSRAPTPAERGGARRVLVRSDSLSPRNAPREFRSVRRKTLYNRVSTRGPRRATITRRKKYGVPSSFLRRATR